MLTKVHLKDQLQRLLRHIKFYTGQLDKSEWRRDNFRFIWQMPAQIQLLEPDEVSGPIDAWTGTISASGIDVRSPRALKRGQKVLITLELDDGHVQVFGTVMHSTDLISRHKIGVKLDLEET